jgi:hypothetical protein
VLFTCTRLTTRFASIDKPISILDGAGGRTPVRVLLRIHELYSKARCCDIWFRRNPATVAIWSVRDYESAAKRIGECTGNTSRFWFGHVVQFHFSTRACRTDHIQSKDSNKVQILWPCVFPFLSQFDKDGNSQSSSSPDPPTDPS